MRSHQPHCVSPVAGWGHGGHLMCDRGREKQLWLWKLEPNLLCLSDKPLVFHRETNLLHLAHPGPFTCNMLENFVGGDCKQHLLSQPCTHKHLENPFTLGEVRRTTLGDGVSLEKAFRLLETAWLNAL